MTDTEYREWKYGPGPLNPDYNPNAKIVSEKVVKTMQERGYYDTMPREERAKVYKELYDEFMKEVLL